MRACVCVCVCAPEGTKFTHRLKTPQLHCKDHYEQLGNVYDRISTYETIGNVYDKIGLHVLQLLGLLPLLSLPVLPLFYVEIWLINIHACMSVAFLDNPPASHHFGRNGTSVNLQNKGAVSVSFGSIRNVP